MHYASFRPIALLVVFLTMVTTAARADSSYPMPELEALVRQTIADAVATSAPEYVHLVYNKGIPWEFRLERYARENNQWVSSQAQKIHGAVSRVFSIPTMLGIVQSLPNPPAAAQAQRLAATLAEAGRIAFTRKVSYHALYHTGRPTALWTNKQNTERLASAVVTAFTESAVYVALAEAYASSPAPQAPADRCHEALSYADGAGI